jgi:hypothetical protein
MLLYPLNVYIYLKELKGQMDKLDFYDLAGKKHFKSADYKLVKKTRKLKSGKKLPMTFAVAKAPSGHDSWKILGKDDLAKMGKGPAPAAKPAKRRPVVKKKAKPKKRR